MGKAIKNFKKATSESEDKSIETDKEKPVDKLEQKDESDSESSDK
jgi:Sec-independent protein translocase protein TatA